LNYRVRVLKVEVVSQLADCIKQIVEAKDDETICDVMGELLSWWKQY